MFYVRLILISIISVLCSGCETTSAFSKKEFLKGQALDIPVSEIQDNLSRNSIRRGFTTAYNIKAYPITEVMYKTENKDIGFKEGWSAAQLKNANDKMARIIRDRTCFMVKIRSGDYDATLPKYWGGTLIQDSKDMKANFLAPNKTPGTVTTRHYSHSVYANTIYTNSYDIRIHYNSSYLCTNKGNAINLMQPFELHLQPRYKKNEKVQILQWLGAE